MNEKFGKKYSLKRKKVIDELFKGGKSIKQYPFVLYFAPTKLDVPMQFVISAPKRNFKKAHDRNRIKRLMKEAVRKNKFDLETFLKQNKIEIALFLIYSAKEEMTFEEISKKSAALFNKLIDTLK